MWNALLHDHLQADGFTRSLADSCLYVKNPGTADAIYVAAYVDDLLITSGNEGIQVPDERKVQDD